MKALIIDNYDSFTWNLYQYSAELNGRPEVHKNNRIDLPSIEAIKPSHIIISPGPGTVENMEDFGICDAIIAHYKNKIPILGVCLGHQGIIKHFGGKIERAPEILHGKQSEIFHNQSGIYQDIPSPFKAMRYHSLCGSTENLPEELIITAKTQSKNGKGLNKETIMGVQHCKFPVYGIQFHPESFGTPFGKQIIKNFLNIEYEQSNSPFTNCP